MNYFQINQILTIIKYMNLTKASEELFITQPALSQALKNTENELGFKLFHRDGKRLSMSAQCEELLPYFERYIDVHNELIHKASSMAGQDADSIVIGFAGSPLRFSMFFMSDFFFDYRNHHIETVYADISQIEKMLLSGEIDIAITFPPVKNEHVRSRNLSNEKIKLAVPTEHALSSRKSISVTELKNYPFFGLPKSNAFRKHCDHICSLHGIEINYVQEVNYDRLYQIIDQNAVSGELLNFCSDDVYQSIYENGYRAIPIKEKGMSQPTVISWLAERRLDQQYKALFDYIISAYKTRKNLEVNARPMTHV